VNRLGLKPEECLVLEDNRNGIEAARAAGTTVMEVASPEVVHFENIIKHIHELEG